MDLIQIYEWWWPNRLLETVTGVIKYDDYLSIQKKRLEKNPDRIVEIREMVNPKVHEYYRQVKVSLWANKYCEIPRCHKIAIKKCFNEFGIKHFCAYHVIKKNR